MLAYHMETNQIIPQEGYGTLLTADGCIRPVKPNDARWSLDELEQLVGGYAQLKELDRGPYRGYTLVLNEERLDRGLPDNEHALLIWHATFPALRDDDELMGDAVLVKKGSIIPSA